MTKILFSLYSFLPILIFTAPCVQNISHNEMNNNEAKRVNIEQVIEATVLAEFSANITTGEAPLLVTFTNLSENATTFSWDFGDGETSTDENPNHIYIEEGTYTVSLVASNESSSDTKTKTTYIIVTKAAVLEAVFTADTNEGEFPLVVTFTNNSNNATSFNWIFGDGETSSEISPKHTYTGVGDYTVSLIAINDNFADTLTKANYITVKWAAPKANFTATPVEGIDPLTVVFTDNSENAQTWLWDFGDGSPNSLEQHPTHIFPRGIFSVSLLVTNPTTNDFLLKQNFITVNPNGLDEKLKGKFKFYPNPVNESITIELLNENYKDVEFELMDTGGKILKTVKPNLNETIIQNINIGDWEAGNYLLRINIGNENMVVSIVKQ